ncbi:MAG: formate/nitrite transporter family protein [Lachnospiraceae bacterium]|nr:formate/nitrite transporter family protein [Lachnospiraceae bacterium]
MKEVIDQYIAGCKIKVEQSMERILGKAILAGAMIGMGAAAGSVAAHMIPNVGLARLVAGLVFPVGLMMVILLGAELFTGDCLMAMSLTAGKQKNMDVTRVLVMVYLGNAIGAIALATLISMSGQLNYSDGMLGAYTIKVALGKVNLSVMECLVSGILCNILVCAAVLMAMCAKDITGKLVAIFFTILLFVTAGFEHCVANMYYLTAGLIAKQNPAFLSQAMEQYGYTEKQLQALNIGNAVVANLIPVTIGNILGGIFFLGIPLYYLHKQEVRRNIKTKEERNHDGVYSRDIPGTIH